MLPLSDENPTLRKPLMTYAILASLLVVWVVAQGAGLDERQLAVTVCNYGLVPAELTHTRPIGYAVPIGAGLACAIDASPINMWTPLTSMFLHGGWAHILGNGLFFWIFGNNVEDSMGRARFLVFYLLCGIAAAATHVLVNPTSPVPTVGASGAISGVLGAYLVLYPRVRVNTLLFFVIFVRFVTVPAWLMLLYWFGYQVLLGLPELTPLKPEVTSGVAAWAHVGGFVSGVVLVKLFENRALVRERESIRHLLHPEHP